jgi:hypothetical protein
MSLKIKDDFETLHRIEDRATVGSALAGVRTAIRGRGPHTSALLVSSPPGGRQGKFVAQFRKTQ